MSDAFTLLMFMVQTHPAVVPWGWDIHAGRIACQLYKPARPETAGSDRVCTFA